MIQLPSSLTGKTQSPSTSTSGMLKLPTSLTGKIKTAPVAPIASPSIPAPVPSLNRPTISPATTPNAFKGSLGGGYGAAVDTDPASGKPLLTFENQKAQASQLLSDRTAPSYDPTIPQKVDPKILQDPRMKQSVSDGIRKSVGATAFQELDHIMPLELGGSNNKSNLRLEGVANSSQPYSSSNPTPTDSLENALADQVHSGKISLVDGWKLMAQAKGLTLPEHGGTIPNSNQIQTNQNPSSPSLWDNIVGGAKTAVGAVGKGINSFLGAAQDVNKADTNIAEKTTGAIATIPAKTISNPKSVLAGAQMGAENFGLGVAKAFVATTGLMGNKQAPAAEKWLNDNQNALNEIWQNTYADTKDKQTAYLVGNMAGSMLPYSLTGLGLESLAQDASVPILSNYGGALTLSQAGTVANVIKQIAGAVAFLGTGQIAHTDAEGSRWHQFLWDAATLAVFKGLGVLHAQLKGEMPFATAEEKMATLLTQGKNDAIDTLNTYIPKDQKIAYDASPEDIKKGYYQAAHANHPDLGGQTGDMQKINGAYSYLTSSEAKPHIDVAPKEEPKSQETKTLSSVEQPKTEKPSIPKERQPLAEEARKYKSVEEFVNSIKADLKATPSADSRFVYHVSENLNITELKAQHGNGVYFTPGEPSRSNGFVYALDRSKLPSNFFETDKSSARDLVARNSIPKDAVIPLGKIENGKFNKIQAFTDFYNQATKGNAETIRVSNSLMKHNQGLGRKEAEAMAKDVIENRKFNVPESKQLFRKGDQVKVIGKHPTLNRGDVATVKSTITDKYGNVEVRVSTGKNTTGQEIKNTISADLLKKVDVPEAKAPERKVELGSGFNPNLDKFIEEDIKPAAKGLIQGVSKTFDLMKKMVNPASRGSEAQLTASIMRESLGRMARDKEIVYESLSKAKKTFDSYSKEESLKLIDGIETGNPTEGSGNFVKIVRQALDSRWAKIQEIKGSDAYIENYFPHIWEDPEKAKGVLSQFFGKRPLEGTKSYMKQRKIPTIKEGIALGLTPTSYNPVELVMARIADMDRFLMANDVWTQFKEQGLRKFVGAGEKPPEGWIQVNDKISKALQFSPTEKAMVIRGNWYMPEQAATIVNNYLSPGLANNPIYNAFRMLSNNLNMVQLGMSGFHALFTSGDAVISKAALSIQQVFTEPTITRKVQSLGVVVSSPVTAPYLLFKNLIRGNKLLGDYFRENPQIPDMVDALERAGGRVRMDSFYLNNAVDRFLKALRGGNYLGAIKRTPGAMIETTAKPIMQYLVPRQKLGIFADMAETILKQGKAKGWSEQLTTLRLQEAWDSVDNRMGQLVYDNLFWNKVLKDLGMAATRSLGWNLGTIRELGGAAVEYAKIPFQAATKAGRENIRMTPKMAYAIALPFVVGTWGAIMYYLYNHKAPEKLLDYYYVPTGKVKPDGTKERIAIPSYMKDVFAYKIEGLQTIIDKVNPEIAAIIDMLQNKDYYGTEIRNPNDSLVKQTKDILDYQASQFVPFTITNLIQRQKAGDSSWFTYLQSFSGITPAPAYITRSPLQTEIGNLYDKRFGGGTQTEEQMKISQAKAKIRTAYLTGDNATANTLLKQAVKQGIIKPNGVAAFIRDADIPSDVKLFQRLPDSDQQELLKGMELYQLLRYAWYANNTVKSSMSSLSGNAKVFVDMQKKGEVKKPTWKRGQEVQP